MYATAIFTFLTAAATLSQGDVSAGVCKDSAESHGVALELLQKRALEADTILTADESSPPSNIGKASCKCVGINNKPGFTEASIAGKTLLYPADTGSRCAKWDYGRYPGCVANASNASDSNSSNSSNSSSALPSFCSDSWCYVDPCSCKLPTAPKASGYFPNATFQGRTLYYSYATCEASDSYTDPKVAAKDKAALKKECATPVKNKKSFGNSKCKCIGISNRTGTTYLKYGGKIGVVSYPGAVGTSCSAWEMDSHPDCQVKKGKPSWCSQSWCYVDPCSCDVGTTPKLTKAMEGASFQGKPLYYSYATCGGSDSWTSKNHKTACVNQKSKKSCAASKKCAWTGSKCVGKELAKIC
jgi:hypothetical protein